MIKVLPPKEYVADHNKIDVSTIVWQDYKIVNLVSTFADSNMGQTELNMGGVDLLDIIMGNKILKRNIRWSMSRLYHYLDLTMANAWILRKRVAKHKNLQSGPLSSVDFCLEAAVAFWKMGINPSLSSRRSLEGDIQTKKHKGPGSDFALAAIVWWENQM